MLSSLKAAWDNEIASKLCSPEILTYKLCNTDIRMYYSKYCECSPNKLDTIAVTGVYIGVNKYNTVCKYNPKCLVLLIHSVKSKASVLGYKS